MAARCALSPVEKTIARESSPAFLAHLKLARRAPTRAQRTHHACLPEVETRNISPPPRVCAAAARRLPPGGRRRDGGTASSREGRDDEADLKWETPIVHVAPDPGV